MYDAAACGRHWVSNHFGMDDLNWNHISARSNSGGILITPGDKLWDLIQPADIVKVLATVHARACAKRSHLPRHRCLAEWY